MRFACQLFSVVIAWATLGVELSADDAGALHCDLANATYVRVTSDASPKVVIESRLIHATERQRTVTITKLAKETRRRTVKVNGIDTQQVFVVTVPMREDVSQRYSVNPGHGHGYAEFAFDEVVLWDLSGKKQKPKELLKRSSRFAAILLPLPWPTEVTLSDAQKAVLGDDTLFVYAPTAIWIGHQVKANVDE
ncbi:hypothetical protein Enr13x_70760 [Stieleria neptunia]|uniref:Uncharacterized protein n=1 Tax=Stieleria neptunia TaxID=2527979 RepID=A0A518I2C0_9BACT|nr:hypothetical protein [Stieleria neptunia]QDV47167.1 hypothetical protein Enr13x_70760 [Stieleria neptunia]